MTAPSVRTARRRSAAPEKSERRRHRQWSKRSPDAQAVEVMPKPAFPTWNRPEALLKLAERPGQSNGRRTVPAQLAPGMAPIPGRSVSPPPSSASSSAWAGRPACTGLLPAAWTPRRRVQGQRRHPRRRRHSRLRGADLVGAGLACEHCLLYSEQCSSELNSVHLSGVLPGRRAQARPDARENP